MLVRSVPAAGHCAKIATVEDAHNAIRQAIAAHRAAKVDVPIALYRAAHALSYEMQKGGRHEPRAQPTRRREGAFAAMNSPIGLGGCRRVPGCDRAR